MAEDAPPDRKLDRLIEAIVRLDRRVHALPADLSPRNRRWRRASRSRRAGAHCRHFRHRERRHRRGARQKMFQPVHPALAHFTIVAPLLMFRAAAPVRAQIRSMRHVDIPEADSATLVRHLQMVARRMLASRGVRRAKRRRSRRVERGVKESSRVTESKRRVYDKRRRRMRTMT